NISVRNTFGGKSACQRTRECTRHLDDHWLWLPREALRDSDQVSRYSEEVGKLQNETVVLSLPSFCSGIRPEHLDCTNSIIEPSLRTPIALPPSISAVNRATFSGSSDERTRRLSLS